MIPNTYPLPQAHESEIQQTIAWYRDKYGVNISHSEAKRLLEGVMQFVYLTEIEDNLAELRSLNEESL